jgi:hypothetical protein
MSCLHEWAGDAHHCFVRLGVRLGDSLVGHASNAAILAAGCEDQPHGDRAPAQFGAAPRLSTCLREKAD